MTPLSKIVFIGAGNMAWNLAPALDSLSGVEVVQVVARSVESASGVTSRLKSAVPDTLANIHRDADLYIIAVNDTAVATVARELVDVNQTAILAHTSGSVPLSALEPHGNRIGVFYPMQTFSKGVEIEMNTVPFFIEGATDDVTRQLLDLARRLSPNVTLLSGDDRTLLHASAVMACNFSNHLWAIAEELLKRRNIPFDVLRPLVEETVRKAFTTGPDNGQTGPARRGDVATINRHAEVVGEPYDEIYRLLSRSIINRFK